MVGDGCRWFPRVDDGLLMVGIEANAIYDGLKWFFNTTADRNLDLRPCAKIQVSALSESRSKPGCWMVFISFTVGLVDKDS